MSVSPPQSQPEPTRAARLEEIATLLRNAFWVLALGLMACFAFFVAFGGVHPGQVAGLTIAMGVLAVLWIVHARLQRGAADRRDPELVRQRERRGF